MYELFNDDIELVFGNNRIIFHKIEEDFIPCIVADYNEEIGEYAVAPFKDVIGVSGERNIYYTKEIYVRV